MNALQTEPSLQEKIRRSLVFSIYDGIAFSVMFGMSDSFFQAFGLHLGASGIALGLIRTLPLTIGSLSQLWSGRVAAFFKSRRRFISLFSLLHALMFIPVFLSAFLGAWRVAALITALVLTSVFFMLPVPLWSSWMGDLMDEKTRGAYLGRRSSITGLVTFPSLLLAGFIMQEARASGHTLVGFAVIFGIAFLARSCSSWFLHKKYDPPYDFEVRKKLSWRVFLSEVRRTNAGTFIVFMGLLNFGLMMVAAYVDPFLLKSVRLAYLPYTLSAAVMLGVKFLFMPFWGKACDRYGTRKVLVVSGMAVAVVPILWIWGYYLPFIFIIQVLAGFGWAGFEISAFNFLFDNTNVKNRVSVISVYSMVNGVSGLLGSLAAGLLVEWAESWPGMAAATAATVGKFSLLPASLFWAPHIIIFLASGVIRTLVVVLFISRLKEARHVQHIRAYHLPLRVVRMMTAQVIVSRVAILARIIGRRQRRADDGTEAAPPAEPPEK